MHATDTASVVNVEAVVVIERQGPRRAHVDNLIVDHFAAILGDKFLDLILVNNHVVAPCADKGNVGAVGSIDAIVGAAAKFKLHFIGQAWTMHIVEQIVDDRAQSAGFIIIGLLTTGRTNAAH